MVLHYNLYDALVSINVPTEKARAVIDALIDVLGHEMKQRLATKADLEVLGGQLRQEMHLLRKDLEIGIRDVTIRNGYMLAALKFT